MWKRLSAASLLPLLKTKTMIANKPSNNSFSRQKYKKIKSYNFKGKQNKRVSSSGWSDKTSTYFNQKHICWDGTYIAVRDKLNKLAWFCHICRKFKQQPQSQTDQEMARFFPNLYKN